MWIYIFTQHQLFTSWWADKPAWHQEMISLVTVDIKITTVRDKLSVTPHELVTREINERPAEQRLTEEVKTNRTSAAGSLWVHYWGGGRDPNDPAHSPPGRTARCQNKSINTTNILYQSGVTLCCSGSLFYSEPSTSGSSPQTSVNSVREPARCKAAGFMFLCHSGETRFDPTASWI